MSQKVLLANSTAHHQQIRATSKRQVRRRTEVSAGFLLLCATGIVPSINIQHRRSIEARHGRKVVVAGAAVMGLVAGGCISFVFRCSSFVAGASVGLEPGC